MDIRLQTVCQRGQTILAVIASLKAQETTKANDDGVVV
jgi:hypothetical protein